MICKSVLSNFDDFLPSKLSSLTIESYIDYCARNAQTYVKDFAAYTARFLTGLWPLQLLKWSVV